MSASRVDVADRDEAVGASRRGRLRGRGGRRGSRQRSDNALLRDRAAADAHELADRRVDEPRRVVVAVAAARPVDEHGVLARRSSRASGAGTRPARAARRRAERSFFTGGGTGSRAAVRVPGRGEYGKTCTFVIPASLDDASVLSNARSSSPGKPTITSRRQVEVRRAARGVGGTSRPCSGGPSRAARRRRPTAAGRAGGGRRRRVAKGGDELRRRRG